MNVLILSPWLPHPEIMHAGGQHLYHTIRSLVERGHRISFLGYGRHESGDQIAAGEQLCRWFGTVTPAYTAQHKMERFRRGGWRRFWLLGRRTHKQMRDLIPSICRQQDIEVVHFAWTEMGRYLDSVPAGVGTVLATLDVEHLVRPREAHLEPDWWRRLQARRSARILSLAERHYLCQADVILACSDWDRAHLAPLTRGRPVYIARPWIDAEAMRGVSDGEITPGRATFMGAMDRMANISAARFLIDQVWPRLIAERRDATLHIVGANPPESLVRQAHAVPGVRVTGRVPQMAAEWEATQVALCPSLIGGGLVTKVAQPMAAGRPVVTTTYGNEGIGATPGIELEVADTPKDLAEAAFRLMADRPRWAAMAGRARRFALEVFDWQVSLGNLEQAYLRAVANARERNR